MVTFIRTLLGDRRSAAAIRKTVIVNYRRSSSLLPVAIASRKSVAYTPVIIPKKEWTLKIQITYCNQ